MGVPQCAARGKPRKAAGRSLEPAKRRQTRVKDVEAALQVFYREERDAGDGRPVRTAPARTLGAAR